MGSASSTVVTVCTLVVTAVVKLKLEGQRFELTFGYVETKSSRMSH